MPKKTIKKTQSVSPKNKKTLSKSVAAVEKKTVKKSVSATKGIRKKKVPAKTSTKSSAATPLKKSVRIKGAITTSLASVQQAEAKKKKIERPAVKAGAEKTKVLKSRLKTTKPADDLTKNIRKKTQVKRKAKTLKSVELPKSTSAVQPLHEEQVHLPGGYGDNFIYLAVRDPFMIYTYWEIQSNCQQRALDQLGGQWDKVKSVLRVHDLNQSKGFGYWDIYLSGMATSWFIEVAPNRSFYVEIGLLHDDGRFVALAVSQQVTTPRIMPSEILDEEWMGIDFDTIYALSGGFEAGKSSAELHRMMQDRLMNAITSGSGGSGMPTSPAKMKKRGFWFHVDCEVIIHGATEPDAQVTFQGQPVRLRSDGTFSFRFPLPDGTHFYEAKAVSSDGVEERSITPIVERNTQVAQPVIRFSPQGL